MVISFFFQRSAGAALASDQAQVAVLLFGLLKGRRSGGGSGGNGGSCCIGCHQPNVRRTCACVRAYTCVLKFGFPGGGGVAGLASVFRDHVQIDGILDGHGVLVLGRGRGGCPVTVVVNGAVAAAVVSEA